jgi:hypothetical protein
MQNIALVACTSRKAEYPTEAKDLYRSPLFEGSRGYAEMRCAGWFVLSAKHGLVHPATRLEPYNETLHGSGEEVRKLWADRVVKQYRSLFPEPTRIIFLAGENYRKHLIPQLGEMGHISSAPLASLGIGSQVAWLQKLGRETEKLKALDRFYSMLFRLRNLRPEAEQTLGRVAAKDVDNERGVYFFFEHGEERMTSPFENRVTRIGTHGVSSGSRSSLWTRLRTHRGARDGTGNHRSSIFRLHVGRSLINAQGLQTQFPSWGVGQSADANTRNAERELEIAVSHRISAMRLLWVGVNDIPSPDSDRAYLERNLIALLCGRTGSLDLSSPHWLGRFSDREAVCSSGIWNVNHVNEIFDVRALEVLEHYIEVAEGSRQPPSRPLAPKNWRIDREALLSKGEQLHLI